MAVAVGFFLFEILGAKLLSRNRKKSPVASQGDTSFATPGKFKRTNLFRINLNLN